MSLGSRGQKGSGSQTRIRNNITTLLLAMFETLNVKESLTDLKKNSKKLKFSVADPDPGSSTLMSLDTGWKKNIQDPQHWIHRFVLWAHREMDGVPVPTVPGGLRSGLSAQHQPFLLLEVRLAQHLTQLRNSSSLLRL